MYQNIRSDQHIPRATIQRLATYLQVLEAFDKSLDGKEGRERETISSDKLAAMCDVNASQVRKDLAYFGQFGTRGLGYYVTYLIDVIKDCVNANRRWRAALVGVGNMGRALLNYKEFGRRNFTITGVFDCDPFKIGDRVYGLEIYSTESLIEKIPELGIEIGIITVPAEHAQDAAEKLVAAGIRGILNYSSARIRVSSEVPVEYVNFFHQLYSLTYNVSKIKR